MKLPEETAKELIDSREPITVFIHNTHIEIKRLKSKALQGYRFYGGKEADEDCAYINYWSEVLKVLSKDSKTLKQLYGYY